MYKVIKNFNDNGANLIRRVVTKAAKRAGKTGYKLKFQTQLDD